MKKVLRDNGLSIVLILLFLLFWFGQAITGYHVHADDQRLHGQPSGSFGHYLTTGHFWGATGENWESEFLQMGFYVVLTSFLYQRGSAESNDPDEPESPKKNALARSTGFLRRNSLSLALLALFLAAFCIHASGGYQEYNEELAQEGQPLLTFGGFLTSAEFWFQSFQNWQSEFLAVLAIVLLTITLRQHGSP
ncbi:MAG: hypothetical protein JWO82_3632, partial [Akkermansiaceae bacterium]|nr:hypothetical protein [Akkermansiaceae bacterium]